MNRTKNLLLKKIAISGILLVITAATRAQQSEGCIFLQGNYVEVGIAPNGAFGTPANAPTGYHSRPTPLFNSLYNPATGQYAARINALGFVADYGKDGWDTGFPSYFGDYFMPGAVQEGFSIQIDGLKSNAWSNNYQSFGNSGFTGTLSGSNTSFISTPTEQKAIWEGTMSNMQVRQTISLKTSKAYFTANIFFKNNGSDTLRKVYYMRTVDPDNEVSITGSFITKNKIAYQLPNTYNKTLVTATGTVYPSASYLGLGTKDCQARCFYLTNSLFADANMENIYNGAVGYNYADTLISDVGIGLIFKIGDIPPGDSTSFSYAYILNEADLDDAFAETEPGFMYNGTFYPSGSVIVQPTGSVLPISVVNGNYYTWTWSPATFLNTTIGPNVDATVSTGPVTYSLTGVGTGVVASRCSNRLMNITVSPYPVIPPPAVSNALVYYCLNQVASPLQASGPGIIHWYTTPAGGTGSLTPPLPLTTVPGTFTWYVTQEIGGVESVRVPVKVIVKDAPLINISPASPYVCIGDTVSLIVSGTTAVHTWAPFSTLSSSTGDTVKAFPPVTQIYTITATDSSSCKNTKTVTVEVKPLPAVTITPAAVNICAKDSVQLTAGDASLTFNWQASPTISTTTGPVVIVKPGVTTNYTVTGTDALGCKNQTQAVVTVKPLPVPDLGPDKSVCLNSTLVLSPGTFAAYLWQDGSSLPDYTLSTIGQYWVLVTDNFGCKASDTLNVPSVLPQLKDFLPDNTLTFCKGNQLVLKVPGFIQYLWSDGTTSSKITITKFGKYTLDVTDQFGCKGTDSIIVYDAHCIPFAVPNAFTPNRDSKNDLFRPVITQIVKGYKMSIWNRWGELLYETSNYQAGWDGTFKGTKQASGVYVYLIEFIDADGIPVKLKNTFTLIR